MCAPLHQLKEMELNVHGVSRLDFRHFYSIALVAGAIAVNKFTLLSFGSSPFAGSTDDSCHEQGVRFFCVLSL